LEGIDQSGKRTQARLLVHRLKREDLKVESISFPIYESPSGRQIQRFLMGRRDYPPQALHMLYSLNRWENRGLIHRLVARNDFVIADRYTPSNLAYGVSRGLSLRWLKTLDEGLPFADLVIVLDVPATSSFARKRRDRDVHENDRRLLVKVRQTYKAFAIRFGWKTIDATRPVGEVESVLWSLVARRFKLS
jgi:dTMP kinase